MRGTTPVVAVLLVATGLLIGGALVILVTETLPEPRALAVAVLLAVALLAASALGARGGNWLSTPYW